eukprot:COSAG02_NODE_7635_length_2923_cov_1.481941_2_plen_80_part_00
MFRPSNLVIANLDGIDFRQLFENPSMVKDEAIEESRSSLLVSRFSASRPYFCRPPCSGPFPRVLGIFIAFLDTLSHCTL